MSRQNSNAFQNAVNKRINRNRLISRIEAALLGLGLSTTVIGTGVTAAAVVLIANNLTSLVNVEGGSETSYYTMAARDFTTYYGTTGTDGGNNFLNDSDLNQAVDTLIAGISLMGSGLFPIVGVGARKFGGYIYSLFQSDDSRRVSRAAQMKPYLDALSALGGVPTQNIETGHASSTTTPTDATPLLS